MNIVITMAGLGTRFKEAGYAVPKYRIEAQGRTLFEWSMISLAGFYSKENRYIFVVRKEDGSADFIREMCAKLGFENHFVIGIDAMTDGQATTAMLAAGLWDKNMPLLVYNIDTFVKPGAMNREELKGDGFIPCFPGKGDHWSFVKLNADGRAVEVREKERISGYCTLGAYYFKTAALYEKLYREFFALPKSLEKGERYIAPMYNYLIQKGGEVYISVVRERDVFVLGTPAELEFFNAHFGGRRSEFGL
jgi:dTDP-glucose pyrophosphorylase